MASLLGVMASFNDGGEPTHESQSIATWRAWSAHGGRTCSQASRVHGLTWSRRLASTFVVGAVWCGAHGMGLGGQDELAGRCRYTQVCAGRPVGSTVRHVPFRVRSCSDGEMMQMVQLIHVVLAVRMAHFKVYWFRQCRLHPLMLMPCMPCHVGVATMYCIMMNERPTLGTEAGRGVSILGRRHVMGTPRSEAPTLLAEWPESSLSRRLSRPPTIDVLQIPCSGRAHQTSCGAVLLWATPRLSERSC